MSAKLINSQGSLLQTQNFRGGRDLSDSVSQDPCFAYEETEVQTGYKAFPRPLS